MNIDFEKLLSGKDWLSTFVYMFAIVVVPLIVLPSSVLIILFRHYYLESNELFSMDEFQIVALGALSMALMFTVATKLRRNSKALEEATKLECHLCTRKLIADTFLNFDGVLICSSCKDRYVQMLKEGVSEDTNNTKTKEGATKDSMR